MKGVRYGEGTWIKNASGSISLKKFYGRGLNGKTVTKFFTGKTKSECIRKKDEYEKNYSPNSEAVKNMLFGQYITNWAETYKKNSLKPTTYYNGIISTINCRILKYDIASCQLSKLNSYVLQRYINDLVEHGYSRATIKKSYLVVNNCLNFAVSNEHIRSNPAMFINLPTEENVATRKKDLKVISDTDLKKLTNFIINDFFGENIYSNGIEILFLISTGLRIGEAIALEWTNIDIDNKKLYVKQTASPVSIPDESGTNKFKVIVSSPKTATSIRTVYLSDTAIKLLKLLRIKRGRISKVCNNCCNRVFISKSGTPLSSRNVDRSFKSIQKSANTDIKNYTLHECRHTFATRLLKAGVNIKLVSKLLGHSNVTTTYKFYIHFLDDDALDAVSNVDILCIDNI